VLVPRVDAGTVEGDLDPPFVGKAVVTNLPRRTWLAVLAAAVLLACIVTLASGAWRQSARAEDGAVGTALYTASATWCAPTPTQCQGWGGNARLGAVNSFRFGDEPYPVRVWRGDIYVDVTVVSFCGCRGTLHAIDLSPAAFEVLAPLSAGRIDVSVEVLVDLPPDPRDDRMRDEVRDVLPQTSTEDPA
jgi:hypothetical protein